MAQSELESDKFDARKVLCSWGIHRHSKKVLFESKDVKVKFTIFMCPYCKQPKKRDVKMFFPDGRVCIDRLVYNRLIDTLKWSRMVLNGFPGTARKLSESLQELLESLKVRR
jgi:hypothetical protein